MAALTPRELDAYLSESGYILYLRDRAQLNYVFSKFGKEGWAALANPTDEPTNPDIAPARAAFLAEYDLPEFRRPAMTTQARADLRRALKGRRIPNWVLSLFRPDEFKQITEGGEQDG